MKTQSIAHFMLGFGVGVVTGFFACRAALKKKYENEQNEYFNEYRARMAKINETDAEKSKDIPSNKINYDYDATQNDDIDVKNSKKEPINTIRIIPPEDYGDTEEYDCIELTYFADGVLAEGEDIITNLKDTVGSDFSSHFGEYEDDSVYIRNDVYKCDYEILADNRRYYDVVSMKYGYVANDEQIRDE